MEPEVLDLMGMESMEPLEPADMVLVPCCKAALERMIPGKTWEGTCIINHNPQHQPPGQKLTSLTRQPENQDPLLKLILWGLPCYFSFLGFLFWVPSLLHR